MKVNGRGALADERRFAARDRETVATRRAPPTLLLYQKERGISSVFSRFFADSAVEKKTGKKKPPTARRERETVDGKIGE